MKPKVYIETTIVSYLAASASRDIVIAGHQQITREWWEGRNRFDLFVSQGSWRRRDGETAQWQRAARRC